jgi:predicted flavoprotein YhiN
LCTRLSAPRGKQSTANFLRKAGGLAPVATALLREGGGEGAAGALPADPVAIAALIKATPVLVTGQTSLDRAISSAGGIKWRAMDDHMMLYAKPGVFVAGEMLDWDAPTGGYLLQATFSTAVAAADGARRWVGLPPAP